MNDTTVKNIGKADTTANSNTGAAFTNPNNPTWTKNLPPGIRQNKGNKLWFFNKNICGRYLCECVSRIVTDRETAVQLAEARIVAFRKLHQNRSAITVKPGNVTFADAVNRFKEILQAQEEKGERDDKTVTSNVNYLAALCETWQEKHGEDFLALNPKKITSKDVEEWHTFFKTKAIPRNQKSKGVPGYSNAYTNKVVSVFRRLFEIVIKELNPSVTNHAAALSWLSVQENDPQLPCDQKWAELKALLRSGNRGNKWTPLAADLIEALEYTGCRITELTLFERSWVDLANWSVTIPSLAVKGRLGQKKGRTIGIIPQARELFTRLYKQADPQTNRLFKVKKAYRTLQGACREVGISNLSHHGIRKLFSTRCIEAGIAPAVVAEWLGHRDGGKLALRVYTRVRSEALGQLTDSLVFGKKAETTASVNETAIKLAAALSSDQLEALARQLKQAARAAQTEPPSNVVALKVA